MVEHRFKNREWGTYILTYQTLEDHTKTAIELMSATKCQKWRESLQYNEIYTYRSHIWSLHKKKKKSKEMEKAKSGWPQGWKK